MVIREVEKKIDPAAVLRAVADTSAAFEATLSAEERAALEKKLSANESDPGLAYSTLEREQALEDFELLGAADSLRILADQIQATVDRRMEELYQRCIAAFYVAEEMAKDPAHAELIPHVENMRRAHLAQYGKPIPPKK